MSVHSMTPDEVSIFLRSLRLPESFIDIIRDMEYDGSMLMDFQYADFYKASDVLIDPDSNIIDRARKIVYEEYATWRGPDITDDQLKHLISTLDELGNRSEQDRIDTDVSYASRMTNVLNKLKDQRTAPRLNNVHHHPSIFMQKLSGRRNAKLNNVLQTVVDEAKHTLLASSHRVSSSNLM